MATEQRIYIVTGNGKTNLVRAMSQAQALRHIAGEMFTVEIARAIDVADLMAKGVHLKVSVQASEQITIFGEE